jgi:hypothetical protein
MAILEAVLRLKNKLIGVKLNVNVNLQQEAVYCEYKTYL